MRKIIALFTFVLALVSFIAAEAADITSKNMVNEVAYIPPQCYTVTKGEKKGEVYNPCYSCHTSPVSPNYTEDSDLQLEYALPEYAMKNRWKNLFIDKTERVNAISDESITEYVRKGNYTDENGRIIIADKLRNLPGDWDFDKDGEWDGYTPDCYFSFDSEGFDKAPDGSYTGWRSFAYAPFLGTFWPTNGSTDDVIIRLAELFRKDKNGKFDIEVYKINLAVVEALIKRTDVAIDTVDEWKYGVDLDKNGIIGKTDKVAYDWAPLKGRYMYYVGTAYEVQKAGKVHASAGLYPEGTEFLHSVRYIDSENGDIVLAPRMKELRYAVKKIYKNYGKLEEIANEEMKETYDFPDRVGEYYGDVEQGISNSQGWAYQGFIEDSIGELRPQTFEETVFCMGCHTNLGVTTDSTFAFPRKYSEDAYRNGWYHWTQKSLKGTPEHKVEYEDAGVQYEYSLYLMYNKAGDEFRGNEEVLKKFFDENGKIKEDMLTKLHDDVTLLLSPSEERALELNKAYKVIVEDQSFVYGRDANVKPVKNVHDIIKEDELETGVEQPLIKVKYSDSFELENMAADISASDKLISEVHGKGMAGPDGKRYGVDWQGVISRSRYATGDKDIHFTFPERLTLPTRFLVANGKNKGCYSCHRMSAPVPSANPSVDVKLTQTVSDDTFKEDVSMRPLTKSKEQDTTAVWSPDGEKIAFASDRTGRYQIWVMNADGSGERQLTRGKHIHGWPMWSPDSKKLVFWGHNDRKTSYIKTADLSSGRVRTLLKSKSDINRPAFSPDGKYIAYSAVTDRNWDVWVMTADGKKKYRLTTDKSMESNPIWNSDGSALAYKVASAGEYGLTIERFMTFEEGVDKPKIYDWNGPQAIQMSDWSSNDKKVAYTAEVVTDASGKDRVSYKIIVSDYTLKDEKAGSNHVLISKDYTLGDRGAQFSPDSQKIIFWAWDKNYRSTIWIANADGTGLKQLTKNGYDSYPMWSPDGSKVVFESNRGGGNNLWVMDIN